MGAQSAIVRAVTQASDLKLPTVRPSSNPVKDVMQWIRQSQVDARTKVYDIIGQEGREAMTLASNQGGRAIVDLDPMTQQLRTLRKGGIQQEDLDEFLTPDQVAHTYASLEDQHTKLRDEYYTALGGGDYSEASRLKAEAADLRNRIDTEQVAPFRRDEIESRRTATLGRFNPEQQRLLQSAREEYLNLGRKMPDILEGLADPKTLEDFRRRNSSTPYAASHRIQSDVATDPASGEEWLVSPRVTESNLRTRMGVSASGIKPLIETIEGSDRAYQSPVMAQGRMVQRARLEQARKATAIEAITRLKEAGQEVRELKTPGEANSLEGVVSYMDNGQVRHFAMDGELADVLNIASLRDMSAALSVLGKFQRTQAKMITTWNAGFALRNVPKDFMDTMVFVKELESPADVWKFSRLWAKTLKDEMRNGMYGAKTEFLNRGGGLSNLQSHLSDTPLGNELKVSRGAFGDQFAKIESIQGHLEMTPKVAMFRFLTEVKGIDPDKATYIARTLAGSPDFARKGMHTGEMMKLIQFWNPQVQGIARLDQFRDPQVLAKKLTQLSAAFLATAAWNSQYTNPETGEREIDTVPSYERENNIILMAPDWLSQIDEKGEITSKGRKQRVYFKIPLGHAAKLLLAPIMAATQNIMGEEFAPDLRETVANVASGVLPTNANIDPDAPVSSTMLGLTAGLNPLIRYPAEEMMNTYSYLGIPIEGRRVAGIDPEHRYTTNTSELAKLAARGTNKILPRDATWFTSPERIDHLIKSLAPGVAEIPLSFVEAGLRATRENPYPAGTRPEQIVRSPGIGPMLRSLLPSGGDERRNRQSKDFYRALDRTSAASRTYNKLKREGNQEEAAEYLAENRNLVKGNKRMQRMARKLADNSRQEQVILNDKTKNPEEKREAMAKLYEAKLNILSGAAPIAKSLR